MSLILGTVDFTVDELPEEIELGGAQILAVRRFAGGQLDIQSMGAFDDPVSWSGILWHTNAMTRARALNDMRISGELVRMQIASMSCDVVVSRFKFTYNHDFYVPYHIEIQPFGRIQAVQSVNSNQNTITIPNAMASTATQQPIALSPVALANPSTKPPQFDIAKLFSSAANAPVGAIINQLAPAGTGPILNAILQATHLVGVGETLWSIAARYYGDGRHWGRIATANNLLNPVAIAAGLRLIIPNPVKK